MNHLVQPGTIVYIKDEFYTDNNLSVMEVPRYLWKVLKLENAMAACQFQRRGKNAVLSLRIEMKYLTVEAL
jgi:hypothetical protein